MMLAIGATPKVLWVNVYRGAARADDSVFNAELESAKSRYANLRIADWAGLVEPNQTSWLIADQIHLTATGAGQWSQWLAAQAQQELNGGLPADGRPAAAGGCSVGVVPLAAGATGADVSCLETRLKQLGWSAATPDTTFDAATTVALRAWQSRHALSGTGVLDDTTRAMLGLVPPRAGKIATMAGSTRAFTTTVGFDGDGGPATAAVLNGPSGVAVDSSGNVYIADTANDRIRRVSPTGTITTVAGGGTDGISGDGGLATSASVAGPTAVAVDGSKRLLIAAPDTSTFRQVSATGVINTVAGSGTPAQFSGSGGVATAATFAVPSAVAFGPNGVRYVADYGSAIVAKIGTTGLISRFAGTGTPGDTGNGGPATSAQLYGPSGLAVDAAGNVYVADRDAARIRKITPAGTISSFAGTGTAGFSGDGGPATAAQLAGPTGIAVDAAGNVYVADRDTARIRKITPAGLISTLAGTGTVGFSGDGGPAIAAKLDSPTGIAVDTAGNVYVADTGNARVRKISPAGIITTFAGKVAATGTSNGFAGDTGPATAAMLSGPTAVTTDATGNTYVADTGNNRIRKISPSGTITTIAGTGVVGSSGDGAAATAAQLNGPAGLTIDGPGNVYVADTGNNRIRKVSPTGTITTIAGTGNVGFGGDTGPATAALLNGPTGLWLNPSGNLYIADTGNNRIRKISPSGVITTVAGTAIGGIGGDGAAATQARLSNPQGIVGDTSGNLYVADTGNNRIRKISPTGTITTIAGGQLTLSGTDTGPAKFANLQQPVGITIDTAGTLLIADRDNQRIVQITSAGTLTTIAGTATAGFAGDAGPATAARLNGPTAVAISASGRLVIADTANNRIRTVEGPWTRPATSTTGPASAHPTPDLHLWIALALALLALLALTFLVVQNRRGTPGPIPHPTPAYSTSKTLPWRPIIIGVLVGIVVTSATIIPKPGRATAATLPPLKLLIIGDSYSAGTGGGSYHDIGNDSYGCHRSRNTWGEKLAAKLAARLGRAVNVTNRACNGAVSNQLLNGYQSVDPIWIPVTGHADSTNHSYAWTPAAEDARRKARYACQSSQDPAGDGFSRFSTGNLRNAGSGPVSSNGGTDFPFLVECAQKAPPQIPTWVNDTYDFVALTIGGNDGSFSDVATHCLAKPLSIPPWVRASLDAASLTGEAATAVATAINVWQHIGDPSTCSSDLTRTKNLLDGVNLKPGETSIPQRIRNVLTAIQARLNPPTRAVAGQIVIADYPYLINNIDTFTLQSVNAGQRLKELEDEATRTYRTLVEDLQRPVSATCARQQFAFADLVKQNFSGGTPTAPVGTSSSAPYLNPIQANRNVSKHGLHITDESFHPTPAGYGQYAAAAEEVLSQARLPGDCSTPAPLITGTNTSTDWAHQAGSTNYDYGLGVGIDSQGNIVITGYTDGQFPGAPETSRGSLDMFVTKYDSSGNRLWAHQTESGYLEAGSSVAVDSQGNIVITGGTDGQFPGTPETSSGSFDMFVTKYDSAGNRLWAHQAGSVLGDSGTSVAVDSQGNIVVTGYTNGQFPGTPETSSGSQEMFVTKYDSAGNRLWAHQIGSTSTDGGSGVAVDSQGNIVIAGYTSGQFPGAPETSSGPSDMFVTKYDSAGNRSWAHQTGSVDAEEGAGVAVDSQGNIVITGRTFGQFPGAPETHIGFYNMFVTKTTFRPVPSSIAGAAAGAPVSVRALRSGSAVTLTWYPPSVIGSSPVDGYQVDAQQITLENGKYITYEDWTPAGFTSGTSFTTNCTSVSNKFLRIYCNFRVSAHNGSGLGPPAMSGNI